jgi:CBS domain-containing protein
VDHPTPADAPERAVDPIVDAVDADPPVGGAELTALLGRYAPFDALPEAERRAMAAAATTRRYRPGELVLDAFAAAGVEVFVVVRGQVDMWDDADRLGEAADERLGVGGVFGFSAMLSERSLGPRVVAVDDAVVAAIPAAAAEPAFASRHGARFLATRGLATAARRRSTLPSYSLVADLVDADPLVVAADDTVAGVAARMTACGTSVAVVAPERGDDPEDDRYGLVTDALLRRRVLVEGVAGSAPVRAVVDRDVPTVGVGDSAAEALLLLLDTGAEHVLATDRGGALRGVLTPRHFAVSPASVGVSVHEQIRRAATADEVARRARRVPSMLADLLAGGLATTKVVAVYSAIVDTVVRRALTLTFAAHPDLSPDAFTWLALGSNGRREAVLSSDIDSAAAFDDGVGEAEIARYREAFVEVDAVLAAAGLVSDQHGATARRPAFSRTNAAWRESALSWRAAPTDDQGAMMTSLLVDGRPIHGDPGLPAATRVFGELRRHPGTMRLLLVETLSTRARSRSLRDVLSRRDSVDLKHDALLPIVNIARWAGLAVGSTALSTIERLHAAAGSMMLPAAQAQNLAEIVEILQRLRLRYQLLAHRAGEQPSDVVARDRMSPIDRSVVAEAAREIASVQRRMDNVAAYLPVEQWVAPAPS